jgi:hypothetical protein
MKYDSQLAPISELKIDHQPIETATGQPIQ